MTEIKICGITNHRDAQFTADSGVHALGFILYPPSPRYVTPEKVRSIVDALPPELIRVGVFVNQPEDEIRDIITFCNLDLLQLHGDESSEFSARFPSSRVIKAFFLSQEEDVKKAEVYPAGAILVDARSGGLYGGTGRRSNWGLAEKLARCRPLILAGGLDGSNIVNALRAVSPRAVDINSGCETKPGVKDHEKIRTIIDKVKSRDSSLFLQGAKEERFPVFCRATGAQDLEYLKKR